jgi:hypothetical protein
MLGRGQIEEHDAETRRRNNLGHPYENGIRRSLVRLRLIEIGESCIRSGDEAIALIECEACDLLKAACHLGPKLCLQGRLLVHDGSLYGGKVCRANWLCIENEVSFETSPPRDEFRRERGAEALLDF